LIFKRNKHSGCLTEVRDCQTSGISTSITKRAFQQVLKLESLGVLAGGIAHDFNNLLQDIFGYISMVKLSLNRREKALAMLEQVEQALTLS
jgi:hypothetical protein